MGQSVSSGGQGVHREVKSEGLEEKTADKADFIASWAPDSEKVPAEITAFAYLILLLWLFVTGAGLLSLDALLSKLLGLRKAPEDDSAKA